MTPTSLEEHTAAARDVLTSLDLRPVELAALPASGSASSLPLLGENDAGRRYLLKYYLPASVGTILPAQARHADFARRETAFYLLLDSADPKRRDFPAPRTVAMGPGDPPQWLLLEWLEPAVGPAEEVLGQEHVLTLLERLAAMPTERLMGRRGLPLEHWDPIGYLDQIRHMYDAVLYVLGEARWRHLQRFFAEAVRWTDGRAHVVVHGDFQHENVLVTSEDQPFLLDFERVGVGNPDHDFAWFWIHSERRPEWKRDLLNRWTDGAVGGDRIRAEWGIRSATAYLAIRRLRWGYLTHGDQDTRASANLALLDAALEGGSALFPG